MSSKKCIGNCFGTFSGSAIEDVNADDIKAVASVVVIRKVMAKGRGKFRKTLIFTPENCCEAFFLWYLGKMFNRLSNRAVNNYGWLTAENNEITWMILRNYCLIGSLSSYKRENSSSILLLKTIMQIIFTLAEIS